jgi:hypothetical protein
LLPLFLLLANLCFAQAPHLHEHDYPMVTEESPTIRNLMNAVSADSINANIDHLSGYHTRRYDSRFIYDVQDWLVSRYKTFGVDTVMLHDFEVPYFEQGTADNIINGSNDNIPVSVSGDVHIEFYPLCETKAYCTITKK